MTILVVVALVSSIFVVSRPALSLLKLHVRVIFVARLSRVWNVASASSILDSWGIGSCS